MQDVATLAGVSRTTVSFVLNKVADSNIPQQTQERVWAAIAELGYRPNAIAQGLRSQRTHTIGFISDVIATTPHAGHMIQGAQDLAWANDKLLLLINTGNRQEMKVAAVEMLLDRQVDGIIYATMYHRLAHPPESIRALPTVLLDCFNEDRSLPSVVPDEVEAGYTAVKTLIDKGHQRIGFINNDDDIPATHGRLAGYRQALDEAKIPFDSTLVVVDREQNGGYDVTRQIMGIAKPPSALFCFNDRMAMGAYDALRNLGIRIPTDVAVVGFDNQELIAPNLYPALTTMELPHYQMGQWAVEHLLKLIDQPALRGATAVQHKEICPLIERASA
jgi:LacI family transcriptional regulator